MAQSRRNMCGRKVVGLFPRHCEAIVAEGWLAKQQQVLMQPDDSHMILVCHFCLSICRLCFQHLSALRLNFRSRQPHSSLLLWVTVAPASENWGHHIARSLFHSLYSKGGLKSHPPGYISIYMPPGSFAAANFSIFLIFLCLLGTKSRSTDLWPWTPKRAVILDLHCKNWDQSSLLPPKRAMILGLHCKNWETPINFCAQMLVFKGFEVATQGFGWPFLAHFGGVCRFGQTWASHYIAPYTKWALFGRGGNLSFGGGVGGWGVSKMFFQRVLAKKGHPACWMEALTPQLRFRV